MFLDKTLMAIMGVWGVLAFSWASNGLTLNASSDAPTAPTASYEAIDPYLGFEAASEPANAPTVTTTTITTIAGCDDVVALAASLGWPVTELDTLRRVAKAESQCMAWAHNLNDPNGGSYGVMQINGFWCLPSKYWPIGWLQAHGLVESCDDLFSATANLRAALAIWHNTGWPAWSTY